MPGTILVVVALRPYAWRQRGQSLLACELDEQVLADGVHYERSPPYHCQVLGDLIEMRAWISGTALKAKLEDAVSRMAEALGWLTHPDGLPAQFNDGGLHMSPAPAGLLAKLQHPAQREGSFALADGGYYGWRSGDDYVVIDCGKLGPDYLIGHGHGDILSFEWSIDGKRIIVDQGTFQNLAGPRRMASRATRQHNTVTVDDADQGDFFGAHRCGRRPKVTLLEWQGRADGCRLEGCHDGFARLPGSPSHHRRFDVSREQIIIEDCVEGAQGHICMSGLLLHPACDVMVEGGMAEIDNSGVRVRIECDVPLQLEEAEWYPDLHVVESTQRLRYVISNPQHKTQVRLRRLN